MKLTAAQLVGIMRLGARARDTFDRDRPRRSDYELALSASADFAFVRVEVCTDGELPVVLELRVDRFGDCPDEGLLEAHERMAGAAA